MSTIRFIRYDLCHDGESYYVNDSFTIHTMDEDADVISLLEDGSDSQVMAFVRDTVGFGHGSIDNSGDHGKRIEFLNESGDPCGAVDWNGCAD